MNHPAQMSTPKTAPDFGEPWQNELGDFEIYPRTGGDATAYAEGAKTRDRVIACVNACAGMSDPAAEIQALREAASCLSRLVDHGHADDCLLLNRANAPCDCGVDQAQATLSKLQSLA